MPLPIAVPIALTAGSFIANLFKNKGANKPRTTTSSNTVSSAPVLGPEYKSLQDAILPTITKRLSSPSALPPGLLENGLQTINDTSNAVKQGLDNDLTSRGLGTSPVAGAVMGNLAGSRSRDINSFLNGLPQLERQYQNEDLSHAMQLLNFGRGTSTTGSNTTTYPGMGGSPFGGAIDDMASMLGWLIGTGQFGGRSTAGGAGRLSGIWDMDGIG